jgi:hypothetical protein
VDYNGNQPPNQIGQDALFLTRCYDLNTNGAACNSTINPNKKHGNIAPLGNNALSVTLYNSIFE